MVVGGVSKIEVYTLERLDFDKVVGLVQQFVFSSTGKSFLRKLLPTDNPHRELEMLDEIIRVLESGQEIIPSNFSSIDVEEILQKIRDGKVLDAEELLKVSSALLTIKTIKKNVAGLEQSPSIKELVKPLSVYDEIVSDIHRCIGEDGSVRDSASERLKQLRIEYRHTLEQLRRKAESFVNLNRVYLQEPVATLRDGRQVFPVKATHRSQVKGIVHSVSSSAATYFIEPEEFVPVNNTLRELREQEQEEINRILRALTFKVFERLEKIEQDIQILAHLDTLHARGIFARRYNAHVIYPSEEMEIKLMVARHPLIDKEKVVPVDIFLPKDKFGLVLTGPNTGGKTVSLKTVGLFCCMMMAGFPLPCDENSVLPSFSKIVIDVGDEQDIRQSLSTFSSHVTNIVKALELADEKTLVLLDELGSGTDPVEGAALALAVIQKLKDSCCKFVVTTHLTPIKIHAASDEKLATASVEFDPQTLKPTFRILMGVPGASHAFEIARKLGMDESVLETAQRFIGQEYVDVEKTIQRYQEQSALLREKIEELENERKKIAQIRAEYEHKYEELKRKRIEELDDELKKMYAEIKEMKKQIDETISSVKKRSQDLETLKAAAKVFERQSKTVREIKMNDESSLPAQILEVGDTVRLRNGEAVGRIVATKGTRFIVDFSGIKLEAEPRTLIKVSVEKKEQPQVDFHTVYSTLGKPEIDVRGLTVDEAEPLIEDFIDKLVLSDFKIGYVIHGKGTGRLAVGIWEILRRDSRVKKYRFGTSNEGGTGVTVVEV
ncbi:endonuclease MutS2 [Pseudothermotoga sp. U03pept]|uniref:endonuclease MutS2 n=1 Tax=Pseudothermotoga sp. U03pept TaxID=3447012 RepID=UPI003F0FCBC0